MRAGIVNFLGSIPINFLPVGIDFQSIVGRENE